ncbi:uncharacterized protein LOC118747887 [Rhagoletis pomonella]|uniref:uncharacterized protein LOC118747887 n=1 Tax=Rhagoletis pomonella TaxID=28610 RepID=UPI0017862B56|nr:uncharacterized protein LOC118747887 [Rhagoletis pomonella]
MPKLKCTSGSDQSNDEPIAKVPRRQLKVRHRVDNSNPPLNLCDLPIELLEKIIGYINIWHHNRIRGTSKRLRDANDAFVMHEFKKALHKSKLTNASSYECAALQTIEQATEVYVKSGYESTFCGCILPMLRSSYNDPFCPQVLQINTFLLHFYDMVDELIGDRRSQHARLLHNLTLMRFFKKFDKSTIISSAAMPLHSRIVVELRGPWLGMLWTSKSRSRDQPEKRCNLLLILSEMLMANITGKAFKRVWECLSEIYVYGNDISNTKRVPKTLFTFTMHGSKKICSLFRSCLEVDANDFVWPTKWPRDQFSVNLDITCKEAMKWGCSKSQHMEFGPFAEQLFSEEEEYMDGCSSSRTLLDVE